MKNYSLGVKGVKTLTLTLLAMIVVRMEGF